MKFQVQMKDPDVLIDAIQEAVKADVSKSITDPDEIEALTELRTERLQELCGKWWRYGEYLTVEVDSDAGTCVVVPSRS